jgi:hypothetical protein
MTKKNGTPFLTKAIRDRFTKGATADTLRDEIAVARFTLEQVINSADNGQQLCQLADRINSLLARIESLIETNSRLERQSPSKK